MDKGTKTSTKSIPVASFVLHSVTFCETLLEEGSKFVAPTRASCPCKMKDYDDRAVEKIAISISILYIHIHSCFCTGTEYARYEEMVVTFGSYSTAGTRGLPFCEIVSRFTRAGCVSVQSVSLVACVYQPLQLC